MATYTTRTITCADCMQCIVICNHTADLCFPCMALDWMHPLKHASVSCLMQTSMRTSLHTSNTYLRSEGMPASLKLAHTHTHTHTHTYTHVHARTLTRRSQYLSVKERQNKERERERGTLLTRTPCAVTAAPRRFWKETR